MKRIFGRDFYKPQGARLVRGADGQTAVYACEVDGKLYAAGFWGKSAKPPR